MRALTIHQPWASAIALGTKKIEMRSWATRYRGPLLIHAGRKKLSPEGIALAGVEKMLGRFNADRIPFGALIAIAELVDCQPTEELALTRHPIEGYWGDFSPGRFGLILKDVRAFAEPIGYRGSQGLFNVPTEVVAAQIDALEAA